MSPYQILAVVACFAFLYSLVASRLERTPISGAMIYVLVGVICGPECFRLVDLNIKGEGLSWLAELTLAVVLFTDSANSNLKTLRRFESLLVRLLLVGLPLTIAMGYLVGWVLFQDLGLLEIALLATMLAPTDAALGKAVVTNEAVPDSVRESLNVESGLNDGICVPVLLLFLALAGDQVEGQKEALTLAISLPLQAIGIGAAIGLGLSIPGSAALRICAERGWVAGSWLQIPVIALSIFCFALAQFLGGSGFIACFIGGMTFGALTHKHKHVVLEAAEGTGDTLALLTWFAFGTFLLAPPVLQFDWRILLYAVASLTIIRMLPVYLCLFGKHFRLDTVLFLGWFGPRGLASIVFAVMVADASLPHKDLLIATTSWTILFSVIVHGLSANPLASLYSRRVQDHDI
ncbi:cation:proton antiporter [Gimesia sp.]|uniref:cation:proton antiporter n=1 Tax=Gimesia sp. TaxID=2024833 RepID=UPI0032ED5418